ncbi:D-2-hydroxyacid dehydrogenase [Hymenobacter sp. BT683]|uniref:D-2-hydroxyacid dehydrogenase n=1 Tax=Hymenobacter jeongseonensis TaxID=2791027 RepID=A0ABS0IFK4_9BACT|nr:D-2-hydroxyacid dehydrogenase [Hymenobacter jeongseonensis]MBF9236708.1 D-2-hydroxyacid dehydrogenase [Hymenobacter jeongseonensis]
MRLFVYSPLSAPARAYLQQHLPADITVTFNHELSKEESVAAFQTAEVLLGNPPPAWFATVPPQLQFWQIDSSGFERYRNVQLDVPVANMGDFFAWPCAETMVAGLLALYRHLPELAVLQAEKKWVGGAFVRNRAQLLRGRRVVILGSGAIGLAVRQQLSGFECQVQLLARTDPHAQLHSKEELKAALPETDIVVNCLPGSADGFFSADLVAAMRPGSIYASVGRGNTTDEPALIKALQTGHLGGAVLDVTATEPLPADNPLWGLPNVLLTQHTGGGQPSEDEGKVDVLLRNLALLRTGQPLKNLVELSRGY